jgi:hypothetical protein
MTVTPEMQATLLQLAETLLAAGYKAVLAAHDGNADAAKLTMSQLAAHAQEQPPAITTTLAAGEAVADNALHDRFPDLVELEKP